MKIQVLNKLFGTLVILTNLIFYIPWTLEIITSKGGSEGWGLLFLPLTFCFHLFILTGIFGWLSIDKFNSKIVKATLMTILFLLGLLTIINIVWVAPAVIGLLIMVFFSLIGLTIHKKIKIEQTILLTNIIGILFMTTVKILLNTN
jgi:hypothetical protein